ncbi:DUF3035 domain-containing protein [Sphingomonas desiccabilis]|uniref:DUF3035 domain-containing protein n=1 Tax=Sphingomonas desiccabilis TaxID=429134 RepID=A0A4Q2IPK4_9SPHN|nr:DUF3035 domain-containing protein [Sphingomonas desiccabilis]MBB3911720.1 hypothetical protein [Sphingomonas desiccabilis]RXZ31553.1 DUF3035 domain-containing protein [Sphingomonas desiccabilis]
MRKLHAAASVALALALAGCGSSGLNRARPDEFAVARQAPLVIPPDYALVPPQPGAPRPQEVGASTQALQAMFGGQAQRSASERAALTQAGGNDAADAGIRSGLADPNTAVVDKGSTTQDIVAAPEGDGEAARTTP